MSTIEAGPGPNTGMIDGESATRFTERPWLLYVLLAAVALLYLATIRPGHAWHDDFALYVLHARNLVERIPYNETGFIYNPADPSHSPEVYPPGFPLLLAPVYALFGANLFALRLVVVASVLGIVAVSAVLARSALPPWLALVTAALIGFQPFFVRFKNILAPDLSFVLFVLLSLYLVNRLQESRDWRGVELGWAVLAGLCIYFSIALRTVGLTIFGALLLYYVFRRRLPNVPILVCAGTALVLYSLQAMWMPSAGGYAAQFTDTAAGSGTDVGSLLSARVRYAFTAFMPRMFAGTDVLWAARGELRAPPDEGISRLITVTLMFAVSGIALVGYVLRLKRLTVIETFVLSYLGALLLWGAVSARYLIPVFPLLFFYAAVGSASILARTGRITKAGMLSLALMVGTIYVLNLVRVNRGPYDSSVTDDDAVELFSHIRRCTAQHDRFLSDRPRALALYTGRAGTSAGSVLRDRASYLSFIEASGIDYIVTTPESPLEEITAGLPSSFARDFQNRRFALYSYGRGTVSSPDLSASGC